MIELKLYLDTQMNLAHRIKTTNSETMNPDFFFHELCNQSDSENSQFWNWLLDPVCKIVNSKLCVILVK